MILKKENVNEAAKVFLTAQQEAKNKRIDRMFADYPAIRQFLNDLDQGHPNEANKEVILQLLTIFYTAAVLQKIPLKNVDYDDILQSLDRNAALKRYLHGEKHAFDGQVFAELVRQYPQKEILNYTFFAINNQFGDYVKEERDALFIFYIVKSTADVMFRIT
ncbi:MAG: hypothetical protein ACR2K1_07075 [Saprospiraceae bacterium]